MCPAFLHTWYDLTYILLPLGFTLTSHFWNLSLLIHELVHSFYLLYSIPLWLHLHFCSPVGRHWSCFQFLLLLLQKPWMDILIHVSLCTSVRIPLESHLEVELPSSKGSVCFQLYQILPNCPLKQLCPILHEFLLLRGVKWELFLDIICTSPWANVDK